MPGLTKEAVSAAFMRGYQRALCNHGIPGWSLQEEADKAADEVLALGGPRFCDKTPNCRMAAGHNGGCERS